MLPSGARHLLVFHGVGAEEISSEAVDAMRLAGVRAVFSPGDVAAETLSVEEVPRTREAPPKSGAARMVVRRLHRPATIRLISRRSLERIYRIRTSHVRARTLNDLGPPQRLHHQSAALFSHKNAASITRAPLSFSTKTPPHDQSAALF